MAEKYGTLSLKASVSSHVVTENPGLTPPSVDDSSASTTAPNPPHQDTTEIHQQVWLTRDLQLANGGYANPGMEPYPVLKMNPAPFGLAGFSFSTLVALLYTVHAKGIHTNLVFIGMACFFGGAGQMVTGIMEMCNGNTFGLTTFCSYGAYWIGYGCLFIPSFGVRQVYDDHEWNQALGLYLLGWALVTFMFTMVTLRSTLGLFGQMLFLGLNYLVLAIGCFTESDGVSVAGGVIGIIAAAFGIWNMVAGIATPYNSYIVPHPLKLPRHGELK